jgi:hypothetical protein
MFHHIHGTFKFRHGTFKFREFGAAASNLKDGKDCECSHWENWSLKFEQFEIPTIQWEEGRQLLDVENELRGGYGNERAPWSLSTQIIDRTSHKRKNDVQSDGRQRKATERHCKEESESNEAVCIVIQQYTLLLNKLNCKKLRDQIDWPTERPITSCPQ